MKLDESISLDTLPSVPSEAGHELLGRALRRYIREVALHHERSLKEGVTDFVMSLTIFPADPAEDHQVSLAVVDHVETHVRRVDGHGAANLMGKLLSKPAPSEKFILIVMSEDHSKAVNVFPRAITHFAA